MDIYNISVQCRSCGKLNKALVWNDQEKFYCQYCGELLFRSQKPQGIIYILSHKNMPGLVKIGMTRGSIKNRVQQLSSATGVPGKFTIEAWFVSNKPEIEEGKIHRKLKRKCEWSEHFRMDPSDAIDVVIKILNGRQPIFKRKTVIFKRKQTDKIVNPETSKPTSKHIEQYLEQGSLFDNAKNQFTTIKNNVNSNSHPTEKCKKWEPIKTPKPFEPSYIVWTCPQCLREYKTLVSSDTAVRLNCIYCSKK